jgi:secondary thiamine-phosphate synthase enzyme
MKDAHLPARGFAVLDQRTTTLEFDTPGRGLLEITPAVADWVERSGLRTGLLTLFVRHTSASLLVQENADPEVQADLERFFARLVPDGDALFRHRDEGPDDMPAHVRSALTAVQLSIPVADGRLALGTWQGIYLWEHRTRPHRRQVALHLLGS